MSLKKKKNQQEQVTWQVRGFIKDCMQWQEKSV